MRHRYISSNCFRMIPVRLLEQKKNDVDNGLKRIINVVCRMNETYLKMGAGQTRVNPTTRQKVYLDVPHFSLKLYKKDGKIHQYVHLPKDEVLEQRLQQTLFSDVKSCRFVPDHLELPTENLFTFAIKGHHHLAIELEKEYANKIKSLFQLAGKDQLMYSLTLKEVENHESKRDELTKRLAGINDVKALILYEAKNFTKTALMWLYDFLVEEEETKEKHKKAIDKIKAKLPKKEETKPFTKRKIESEKNRFMIVEVLFLFWTTNEEKVQRFKEALQKLLDEMRGENQLEVVEVKPDLHKVTNGRIHYDLPFLCLYQKELSKFLRLLTKVAGQQSFFCRNKKIT